MAARRLEDLPHGFLVQGQSHLDLLEAALQRLPALDVAYAAQGCSAIKGFDYPDTAEVIGKLEAKGRSIPEAYQAREQDPERYRAELADTLFLLVHLCRRTGLDPEALVNAETRKYLARCRFVEDALARQHKAWEDVPVETLFHLWHEAKDAGL